MFQKSDQAGTGLNRGYTLGFDYTLLGYTNKEGGHNEVRKWLPLFIKYSFLPDRSELNSKKKDREGGGQFSSVQIKNTNSTTSSRQRILVARIKVFDSSLSE